MRIMNRTRGTVLGTRVSLADGWMARLRGFLFRPEPRAGEGILLTPCNAIHTWGMTFSLDVIFLDASGKVLEVIEELEPGAAPERVPAARYVLEVPVGTIRATGTVVGDRFSWKQATTYSLRLQEI
jgi:uncharacterized membrane protein (UPF0127 family)